MAQVGFTKRAAGGVGAALLAALALAATAPSVLHDDISPQPLERALDALAHQTGLQVIYVSALVQGQQSGRAQAGTNAFEALARLLKGTGLTYTSLTAASVRITSLPPAIPEHTDQGVGSADTGDGEEVIVTARFHAEPAWSVPLSVTVLSGEQLEQRGIGDLSALALAIPGMSHEYLRGSGNSLSIRGLWSQDGSSTENNVATVYDGLYISNAYMVDLNMLDLRQVEVLRGPQNALVGRNAFAGAILYEPERPTAQPSSRAEVEGGSDGFARVSGYLSGPLSGTIEGRLAAAREIFDGTIRNRADPAHMLGGWRRDAVSGTLQWTAGGSLSARLSGLWYEVQRDATPRFPIGSEVPPAFNCGQDAGGNFDDYCGALPAPGSIDSSPDAQGQDAQTQLGRFELTWQGPSIEVTSLTGYVHSHSASNPDDWDLSSGGQLVPVAKAGDPDVIVRWQRANVYYSGFPVNDREWSEDLRVSGKTGHWQWLAGAYGARNQMTDFTDYSTDARGLAPDEVFVGNWNATRTPLTLLPGGQSSQRVDIFAVYGSLTRPIAEVFDASVQFRWNRERVDYLDGTPKVERSYATPRFALSYRPGDETQVYVSAARGARSALFNGPPTDSSGVDTNWTYELGVKSASAARPVAGSATVFLVDWSDTARVTGLELEAEATLSRWLSLHALYAYTDARYRGVVDNEGNRLAYAPLQSASLRAMVRGALRTRWQWTFDAGVDLVSSEYAFPDNLDWFRSRQIWNFRCAISDGRWEAALWGRNLGVRHYSSFATFDSLDGWIVVDRTNGGYFGATLAYRFR